MSSELAAAGWLIAVPIAFNAAFFELGRAFDYPDILRKEPDEILRRFAAGGAGLILRWQALLLSALAMLPLVALLTVALNPACAAGGHSRWSSDPRLLSYRPSVLARWPFAVPELARRYVTADRPRRGRHASNDRGHLCDAAPQLSGWGSASTSATC